MNIFDKIKELLFKKKVKELPAGEELTETINNHPKTTRETFTESLQIYDDPLSNLLKPESLATLNIDEALLPVFKEVIKKTRDYFIKNDLFSAKDFQAFFDNYLLNNNLEIRQGTEEEMPVGAGAIYDKQNKRILLSGLGSIEKQVHALCHEFIHFIVMGDSNKLGWCPSQVLFANEAWTELFTSEITGMCPQSYIDSVELIKFVNVISDKKENWQKPFLRDEFPVGDEYFWHNMYLSANMYRNNPDINNYRVMQRQCIRNFIDIYNINSIEDYVKVVDMLGQRATFDKEFMDNYFENLNTTFLQNVKMPNNEEKMETLTKYCQSAYYANECGDKEVVEYQIGNVSGAYDQNGTIYGDFPNGCVRCTGGKIEINHNNETLEGSLQDFKGINWNEAYKNRKEELYNIFDYQDKSQEESRE